MSTVHPEEITSKEQILVRTRPLLRELHTVHVYEHKMQAVTEDREHYGAHHKPCVLVQHYANNFSRTVNTRDEDAGTTGHALQVISLRNIDVLHNYFHEGVCETRCWKQYWYVN